MRIVEYEVDHGGGRVQSHQPTYPNMHPRGLRSTAENLHRGRGPYMPRHSTILDGGLLRFVPLRDVRMPDVAFAQYSLKQNDGPIIGINAISTGALAVRAYLRTVVFVEGTQESPSIAADHMQKPFKFVNAPCP